jgi:outer membrane protein assembly factor BamB
MLLSSLAVSALLGSAALAAETPGTREEALFDAARNGDLAAVTRLLDSGVPVDARSRYGATALFFACDKRHLDVVRLLLDRGADVNATDTFYKATAFEFVVMREARDIARLMVEKGAKEPENALPLAIKGNDVPLVRAVLARGPLPALDRAEALAAARAAKADEIAGLLEAATVAPEKPVEMAADELAKRAGTFAGPEGATMDVVLDQGVLVARQAGRTLTLVPLDGGLFKAKDTDDVWLRFGGPGGTFDYMAVRGGAEVKEYQRKAAEPGAAPTATVAPAGEKAARTAPTNWPSFRGERASGNADGQGAPAAWDLATGRNVAWKVDVPGLGHSSPIAWGDRVFVTTAVSAKSDESLRVGLYGDVDPVVDDAAWSWRLLCFDKKTGRLLWQQVAHEGKPRIRRHTKSTHANPTPATDGKVVVAMFGSEGLFAYDVRGRLLWKKDLGVLDNGWFYDHTYQWGFSSSPVIYADTVIVQVDIQKGSFVAAFDLATGRERWRQARDEISTWGTPTIISGSPDEVVTNGTTVRSYDARTGAPLWTLGPNSEVTVATPVAAEGIAYVTAGYPPVQPIYAVRVGSRGKLDLASGQTSSPAVAWSSTGGTYLPTPILYRGHLYTLHNNGRLSCFDARTGNRLYQGRLGEGAGFSASPVAADGRLYIASEEGDVYVVRAGPQLAVLGKSSVGEVVMASPAISDGLLIFRTQKHLIALTDKAP